MGDGGGADSLSRITQRTALTALIAATLWSPAARSENAMSVDAPLCKQVSVRIAENTKAKFVRFSKNRTGVFFHHPAFGEIVLSCANRYFLNVSLSTESPYPDDLWFYIAAEAGRAIAGLDVEITEVAVRSCHKAAVLDESGIGYAEILDTHIECFAKTDPAGSSISFFLRDAENNKVLGNPE